MVLRSSALILALCAAACGPNRIRILVPPRLDLKTYGRLGLVTFTVENAKGSLPQLVTDRFEEEALTAQPGIEIFELGPADSALDAARAQQIGKERGVAAVFAGHLRVSNPQASGGIAAGGGVLGLVTPHVDQTVRLDLSVRLVSTQSGGTVWRQGAWATEKVSEVSFTGAELIFTAKDPKAAYGSLVNRLVDLVGEDLWSRWEWQTVTQTR
ncbi:MAG TPA: hypothetical protein VF976_01040 [Gemmatimonadales bacterium]